MIHEFDPWFNFRATKYLSEAGPHAFWNWFDASTWYPLGRWVGDTVYPGLMMTAAFMHYVANQILNLTVDIREVCVFTAPIFAALSSLAVYGLTKQVWNARAGLFAALFVSLVPGYVSRSVAGSYDNEAVAIFALVFCFYLWCKALNTGSLFWSGATALGYLYMVASWGGYVFIIGLLPAHVLALMLAGRFTDRVYVAYSVFYAVGTLLSMQIRFVSFQPLQSTEHLPALGVFCLCQAHKLVSALRSVTPKKRHSQVSRLVAFLAIAAFAALLLLAVSGAIPMLTARLLELIGPIAENMAIVKSVSEHQPTSWGTFFFDTHCLMFLAPVGLFFCLLRGFSDTALFAAMYALFATYFSGIMIRIVLVLSPALCVLGGIACSELVSAYAGDVVFRARSLWQRVQGLSVLGVIALLGAFFTVHCSWVTSMAYSSPSIVLQSTNPDGSKRIFDDFREAYQWLSHNTPEDAKVMSWWDYGYQITGMAERSTIVDNNTRNNTHIATVGLAMASTEEMAYPIMQKLGANYVLVVFGGMLGYSSDDINKFLWMVRISGGVFPRIVERDFYADPAKGGGYRIDAGASDTMRNCAMYKMCFHRFYDEAMSIGQNGYDRARGQVVGEKSLQLTHLEEVYTTEHWMVRIYRVKSEHELRRY
ncbi:MAG: hypothetical protein MHM6MM_002603 [Cercozoa sp. M6MM]